MPWTCGGLLQRWAQVEPVQPLEPLWLKNAHATGQSSLLQLLPGERVCISTPPKAADCLALMLATKEAIFCPWLVKNHSAACVVGRGGGFLPTPASLPITCTPPKPPPSVPKWLYLLTLAGSTKSTQPMEFLAANEAVSIRFRSPIPFGSCSTQDPGVLLMDWQESILKAVSCCQLVAIEANVAMCNQTLCNSTSTSASLFPLTALSFGPSCSGFKVGWAGGPMMGVPFPAA